MGKVPEYMTRASRKWSKANMKTIACQVRTEIAEQFKEVCKKNNKSMHSALKEFILSEIEKGK